MQFVADKPGLDPALPDVSLVIAGEERQLCYDYNSIVLAEKATGLNLLRAMAGDITAGQLRGLLWAALARENSELTLAEVGSWIKPRNAPVIYEALQATWFASNPEKQESDGAGEDEAPAKTGA